MVFAIALERALNMLQMLHKKTFVNWRLVLSIIGSWLNDRVPSGGGTNDPVATYISRYTILVYLC